MLQKGVFIPSQGHRRAFWVEGREEGNERKMVKDSGVGVLTLNHTTMTKKEGDTYYCALPVSSMPQGKDSKTLLKFRASPNIHGSGVPV